MEKMLRIALLFREATVLDEVRWQSFARHCGLKTEKGAWEVLNQNVSLGTFKDLLLLDLKTLVPGKSSTSIENALSAAVQITPSEIAYILNRNTPDVARLCGLLIAKEAIATKDLEDALDIAEQNALNVYDVLVAQGLVSPETVMRVVGDRTNEIGINNRALLAGDILVFNNMITREDFSRVLEIRSRTHAPLSRILEQQGLLTQEELYAALQSGMELPLVELIAYDLSPELLDRFPVSFMRSQFFVPLAIQGDAWEIGTASPFNLPLADTIALLTGRYVSVVYTPHNDLLQKFESLFSPADKSSKSLAPGTAIRARSVTSIPTPSAPRAPRLTSQPATSAAPASQQSDSAVRVSDGDRSRRMPEPFVDNLSTVQLVTQIIETAIASRATDIHLEPKADCVRVRYRVDGSLHNVMNVPKEMESSIISRIKVLSRQMDVTERRRPQDGHFSLGSSSGIDFDFRISTLPTFHGEKIVLRVLDSKRVLTGLSQLGLHDEQLHTLNELIHRPHGLVLVTGPTGSGKTSTLYACLNTINREDVNIITIEDPVEYQLDGITQVPVDNNIDLTFAAGLRTALRQDPDIIMVGEVRDPETAHITIRAALTGHQVFSTLHTNTAIAAVSALAHMDVPHYMIASAVTGIVAQRLVRKICEKCRQPYGPPKSTLRELGLSENSRKKLYRGAGCDQCFGSGYSGRTGVFEVVAVNEVMRSAIAERANESQLAEIAQRQGDTLHTSGVRKVLEGITTPDELLKAVRLN